MLNISEKNMKQTTIVTNTYKRHSFTLSIWSSCWRSSSRSRIRASDTFMVTVIFSSREAMRRCKASTFSLYSFCFLYNQERKRYRNIHSKWIVFHSHIPTLLLSLAHITQWIENTLWWGITHIQFFIMISFGRGQFDLETRDLSIFPNFVLFSPWRDFLQLSSTSRENGKQYSK